MERREFVMDNNMIFNLIFAQAGTFGKAILETVQNAIDAKATKVEIELFPDGTGYTVTDDGQGFRNRKEVEDWFEQVGFDHNIPEKANAQFARFGLGRFQQMSFAKTYWKTNHLSMRVDIKNEGLNYNLVEHDDVQWQGCRIEGEFYEKQTAAELNEVKRELQNLMAYASIPVIVNGDQVNTLPQDMKWTIETDDAYIKLQANKSRIDFYNLGVKVKEYWGHKWGVGGTVVSKRHLKLNISRNDVLEKECDVFKRISSVVKKYVNDNILDKPKRLTDDTRRSILNEYLTLEGQEKRAKLWEIGSLKLLPSAVGYVSLKQISHGSWSINESGQDSISTRIQKSKQAIVLSSEILSWFAVNTVQSLLKIPAFYDFAKHYVPFEKLAEGITDSHDTIPDKFLTSQEKAGLAAAKVIATELFWKARIALNNSGLKRRKILPGQSDTAEAWTDSVGTIWINQQHLSDAYRSKTGVSYLVKLLAHEYCHEAPSSGQHDHDQEFYENFHELIFMLDMPSLTSSGIRGMSKHLKGRANKVKVPAWIQRDLSKGVLEGEIPEAFN